MCETQSARGLCVEVRRLKAVSEILRLRAERAEAECDALLAEVEQLKSKVAAVSHECEVARDNSQAIYSAMVDLEHVRDRLDFQLYCANRNNDKAREENARLQAEVERLKALRKGGE